MKELVAADSDRILGFTVSVVGAGEIMAVVQVAMLAGIPYTGLRDAVFIHPTLPEGLVSLFSAIRAVNEILAGKAGDIRTRAADVFAFNHTNSHFCSREVPCGEFPSLARAKHEQIVLVFSSRACLSGHFHGLNSARDVPSE